MMDIKHTLEYFDNGFFEIEHPYASFTFRVTEPILCSGVLNLTVWDLKGSISFDGVTWYRVEDLNPIDGDFIEYYYQCIFNEYGWLYQDIHLSIKEVMNDSIIKTFKIISLSNKTSKDSTPILCSKLPQMNKELLIVLDNVKVRLSSVFVVDSVYFTDEQIMVIDLVDDTIPEVDLLNDGTPEELLITIKEVDEKISSLLKPMGVSRYTLGKIHKTI